jgi:glutamyl-tRNA synthetase
MVKFSLKFTKGDIVVPMTSLDYLQNQHLRRLCEDDTPKSKALFESYVLNPLKRAIKLFESARTSGDGTTPDGTIVPPFGERFATVPLLEDERFRRDLVESVLSAKAENNQTPDLAARFPAAVSHLKAFIWKIPHDVLKASLAQLPADTITLHGAPARLDQVMSHVIENLASVEDDAWVVDRLSQELQRMEEPGEGKAHMLLKILRRALLASPNGMPVGRAMVILGKDETLRRLEAARLAAEETAVPAGGAVPA